MSKHVVRLLHSHCSGVQQHVNRPQFIQFRLVSSGVISRVCFSCYEQYCYEHSGTQLLRHV